MGEAKRKKQSGVKRSEITVQLLDGTVLQDYPRNKLEMLFATEDAFPEGFKDTVRYMIATGQDVTIVMDPEGVWLAGVDDAELVKRWKELGTEVIRPS
jgi:hypothetical protein